MRLINVIKSNDLKPAKDAYIAMVNIVSKLQQKQERKGNKEEISLSNTQNIFSESTEPILFVNKANTQLIAKIQSSLKKKENIYQHKAL